MAYIAGGSPPGEAFSQVGCTDPTPPREDRPLTIPHELYFAGRSKKWEDGGVCFIHRKPAPGVATLGRMYLVTEDQFKEVFYQENAWNDFRKPAPPGEAAPPFSIDLGRIPPMGALKTEAPGWYSTLLHLGEVQGHPIFTFTASWDEDRIAQVPPGPRYRETMVRGIRECYGLPQSKVEAYLERALPRY
jgi:hypothetical protein